MKFKFWNRETRANIENPSTPITGSNITDTLLTTMGFSSGSTASGSTVTPDTAWNYSAVYAAIRLLSETVAQLPLVLYQKRGDERLPAADHPLYSLMHNGPSERQTSFTWRETQMGHVLSWGNGYAYIERNLGTNEPTGLRLLDASKTSVDETAGPLTYVTIIDGKKYYVDAADMLHIPALGTNGVTGISPITMHRETIGLSMRATEFGAEFFGNGASLGGTLSHPGGLGKEARVQLKEAWQSLKGSGYQGVAVLEEGMEYKRIGIPPNDAQFLETRKFQITEIARIYNVPPHMLRDLEKSAFNNMSEQSIEFLRFTMTPWLIKWEQELNRKLLTPQETAGGYYFKFMATGLLRGTQAERYESYGKAINDGWLSRNEVRVFEDMNPVDGLDEYLVPLNMVPSDQLGEVDTDEPVDTARFLPMLEGAADALIRFDIRCVKAATDGNDILVRYAKGGAAQISSHIDPVLQAIDPDKAANRSADFAKWWGDYRESGIDMMEKSVILAQLLTTIGGTDES